MNARSQSADIPDTGPSMTMEDLAVMAGVSVSTVSRALRGHPGVKSATARRVQELARTHRFQPNHSASLLRRGTTQTVAMAVAALNGWYAPAVVAGAQTALASAGFDTLVAVVSGPGSLERILHDASPQTGRVDGVIVVDMSVPDDILAEMARSHTRVVTVGRVTARASSVSIDDREVGRTATNHLLGLGHEVIGIVKGLARHHYRVGDASYLRHQGYLEALAEAGVEARPDLEVVGNYNVMGGLEATRALMTVDPMPTALFCMSDQMAVGAIRALADVGLRVPGDISLIGVDDHVIAASIGLTTVRQDVRAIGQRAAELMVEEIAGRTGPTHVTIDTRLLVRRTTRRRT